MAKVTGIGGVFLRSADPKRLSAWYAEHLGMEPTDWGIAFNWAEEQQPAGTGMTTWSVFAATNPQLGDEPRDAMVNYRVDDMDALLTKLEAAGVWIDPKRLDETYGKFAWIKDCDGNRLELWQPLGD